MKKTTITLSIFLLMFLCLIWGSLRYLEYRAIQQIPILLTRNNTPFIHVTVLPPIPQKCFFKVCLLIPNITIQLSRLPPIQTGEIKVTFNPFDWPWRIWMTPENSTEPMPLMIPHNAFQLSDLSFFE